MSDTPTTFRKRTFPKFGPSVQSLAWLKEQVEEGHRVKVYGAVYGNLIAEVEKVGNLYEITAYVTGATGVKR